MSELKKRARLEQSAFQIFLFKNLRSQWKLIVLMYINPFGRRTDKQNFENIDACG